jgi:drug/metabolite transporter (DMT)-like permease
MIPPWLRWTLIAIFSWGIWAVISKLPGDAVTAGQSQALSTLGLLPMLPLLRRAKFRGALPRGLLLAVAGGVVTCLGNVAYYESLALGGKVATVVALTALYPLVTILLAMLILRERLNRVQSAGIALSMVAIWLFNVQEGSGLWSSAMLHAVLPIALWGLSGFLQKVATNYLPAETAGVVYLASFIPMGIFYALREPWPDAIPGAVWSSVLALGFFLAFGNFAMLAAFACGGKAAVIAPLGGLYPVISVPVAMIFLHETIGLREIAGIVIALLAVAALSYEKPPEVVPAS